MLTYPILEWWANFVLSIPGVMFGIAFVVWIVLSFFGLHEIRNAIFAILTAPLGLFLLCYVSKAAQEYLPLVGWCFIIVRLGVDVCLIGGVIMIIRYFTVK